MIGQGVVVGGKELDLDSEGLASAGHLYSGIYSERAWYDGELRVGLLGVRVLRRVHINIEDN
jgi:hypothetical protein